MLVHMETGWLVVWVTGMYGVAGRLSTAVLMQSTEMEACSGKYWGMGAWDLGVRQPAQHPVHDALADHGLWVIVGKNSKCTAGETVEMQYRCSTTMRSQVADIISSRSDVACPDLSSQIRAQIVLHRVATCKDCAGTCAGNRHCKIGLFPCSGSSLSQSDPSIDAPRQPQCRRDE